jgi:DNA-binding PadR family transcriptional regulator
MAFSNRPSGRVAVLVLALAEEPASWHYGYELCQRLDLTAGSLYPALMGLADRGLLETSWDQGAAAGRVPRHRYRLTGAGLDLAARLAAEPQGRGRAAMATGGLRARPYPVGGVPAPTG